ncbi:hypothetical protein BKA64DRAFT_679811, partial [Cadophora sp. MPI-SDFR-AT-0126]
MKMEKDSYRPIRELDSYRPQLEGETRPMGRSDPEKPATSMSGGNADRVALRTMPNGGTTRVFSPAAEDNKPYRSQRDVIYQKAVAAGVSRKEVEACLEEKAGVAEKKFAERSGDWQMFFVEASTWGRFCKFFFLNVAICMLISNKSRVYNSRESNHRSIRYKQRYYQHLQYPRINPLLFWNMPPVSVRGLWRARLIRRPREENSSNIFKRCELTPDCNTLLSHATIFEVGLRI